MSLYNWQNHLASTVLDKNKTPVFWAGFWPGGEEGIDTRQALADFISSVKGFQLANTEWGQAAESKGANNLEACAWDRKKNFWKAASIKMAQAMALHNVPNITIALHKTFHGKYSFYETVVQGRVAQYGNSNVEGIDLEPKVRGAQHPRQRSSSPWIRLRLGRSSKVSVGVLCRAPSDHTYADGSKYQGQWKNDELDGDLCQQQNLPRWIQQQKDGQGTETYADGSKYKVWYKEGHLTRSRRSRKRSRKSRRNDGGGEDRFQWGKVVPSAELWSWGTSTKWSAKKGEKGKRCRALEADGGKNVAPFLLRMLWPCWPGAREIPQILRL